MLEWTSDRCRGGRQVSDGRGRDDAGAGGVLTGLAADTRVATSMGWRAVSAITAGDKVLTFDAGLQPVAKVTRLSLWDGDDPCPQRFWPFEVPVKALGNRETLYLLPNQSVMVESDAAEEIYGDPFSLIPAAALEGLNGIERVPPQPGFEVIKLHFEKDQVVFANSGALFFCPSARDLLNSMFDTFEAPAYAILPLSEARALASDIKGNLVCDTIQNGVAAA